MPEDRSLDDFGGADADGDSADSSTEPNDAPTAADPPPATSTAAWTTGGADCERCGDRVERRWLDDGNRVCPDCKSW